MDRWVIALDPTRRRGKAPCSESQLGLKRIEASAAGGHFIATPCGFQSRVVDRRCPMPLPSSGPGTPLELAAGLGVHGRADEIARGLDKAARPPLAGVEFRKTSDGEEQQNLCYRSIPNGL